MIENFINNFVSNIQVVTISRALETVYTNNTGKTLFIFVGLSCELVAANDTAYAFVVINETFTGPNCGVAPSGGVSPRGKFWVELVQVISPGQTYKVSTLTANTGTVTLSRWIEAW